MKEISCVIRDIMLLVMVNVFPLASLGDFVRELQSTSGEELSALMPSILDKAFKGEL